ncbi:multicopper oxidase domain-containing protein [Nocardioides sp. AE5]|uniref:multicopper oxidase family protein n=1 Tax=Nocardioides sp. AE5 TaxID=2962573 RepID=UPI002880FDED|nr:multicopper oxidase domain-containing protein [Nocardioides sp. AE5]MDT0203658.1 multicopper oxidase domain-containing protein [Nocardioides sp. AE5]
MKRTKRILVLVVGGTVALLVAATAWFGWVMITAPIDTVGEVDFDRPLAIPPLADSTVDADGVRTFDLTMQRGTSDLGREAPTPTWGVNGDYLGPTVRATRGEQVRINVTNRLGESSTLHWHGMHLPAAMDGGPHQMVGDGETWSPSWEINQPAATLWYHPHPHGRTAEHVYRGVAGMFIIDDENEVDLPSEYGVDDVPVIVQDKLFDGSDLELSHGIFRSTGILGDHVLVNGTPGPYLEVTTERVRLRVLNGSNARIYNFVLSDGRPFHLVGTDGGLLPTSATMTNLEVSPGERAEIVVEMQPGDDVVLRSEQLVSKAGRLAGEKDRLDIMELRAAEELAESPELPETMAAAPDLADDDIATTRQFDLSGTRINGREMDMARIDHAVELDTTELWRVRNRDGNPHNFHVHDVQFQVRSYDGREPPPHLRGWKDTIWLPQGIEAELLLRFTDHADPDVPYMFHCHLLRHEDQGMMGQFVVVEPGDRAGEMPDSESHDHH